MASTADQLLGLIPSAVELQGIKGPGGVQLFPDWFIEDYLNLLRNIVIVSDAVDEVVEVAESDTSFVEGAVNRNLALTSQLEKRVADVEQPQQDYSALAMISTLEKKVEELSNLISGAEVSSYRLEARISAQQKRIDDLEQQV